MSAVVAATVAIIVALLMVIEVASLIVEVVTVADVSTGMVIEMAGVVPIVMRACLVPRVVRTRHDLVSITVAVRVANVEVDIPSAEVDSETSEAVRSFCRFRIKSDKRQCG